MEVIHDDDTMRQNQHYMKKQYSFPLALTKVIYARDEDPLDTIIIRNFYPEIRETTKVFGLKDLTHIRTLFLSLLMLFKLEMKSLRKIKFARKEELEEAQKAIVEMNEDLLELEGAVRENDEFTSIQFYTGSNYINVKASLGSNFPFINLCNEDRNKRFINATSLFPGEGVRLLKYLNSRFSFTYTNVLKYKETGNVFKNDSFF